MEQAGVPKQTHNYMTSWFSTKRLRRFNGEMTVFSTNTPETSGHPRAKRWALICMSHHIQKWTQNGFLQNMPLGTDLLYRKQLTWQAWDLPFKTPACKAGISVPSQQLTMRVGPCVTIMRTLWFMLDLCFLSRSLEMWQQARPRVPMWPVPCKTLRLQALNGDFNRKRNIALVLLHLFGCCCSGSVFAMRPPPLHMNSPRC